MVCCLWKVNRVCLCVACRWAEVVAVVMMWTQEKSESSSLPLSLSPSLSIKRVCCVAVVAVDSSLFGLSSLKLFVTVLISVIFFLCAQWLSTIHHRIRQSLIILRSTRSSIHSSKPPHKYWILWRRKTQIHVFELSSHLIFSKFKCSDIILICLMIWIWNSNTKINQISLISSELTLKCWYSSEPKQEYIVDIDEITNGPYASTSLLDAWLSLKPALIKLPDRYSEGTETQSTDWMRCTMCHFLSPFQNHSLFSCWGAHTSFMNTVRSLETISECENAIASGVDLNRTDQWGYAPIHYAVRRANLKVLKFLLTNNGNSSHSSLFLDYYLYIYLFIYLLSFIVNSFWLNLFVFSKMLWIGNFSLL
jgi:hypothetical protein